jgi:hypothetical protein
MPTCDLLRRASHLLTTTDRLLRRCGAHWRKLCLQGEVARQWGVALSTALGEAMS